MWLGMSIAAAAAGDGSSITEFPTPSPYSLPQGVDIARDGAVFYAETKAGKIVRQQGKQTREYSLPAGAAPNVVKAGREGIWFSDGGKAAIGLLKAESGEVIEYPVPSGSAPNFLQIASDGSIWFTEPSGVGRLAPSREFTEWHIALEKTDSHLEQISIDGHGYVWFTELNYDGVGSQGTNLARRLDPGTNEVRAYAVPTLGGSPAGVTNAASGRIWVSEHAAGKLALLDPEKAVFTTTAATRSASRSHEAEGPAGGQPAATSAQTSAVTAAREGVRPVGTTGWVEYTVPPAGGNPEDMRVGADGRLYFEDDRGYLGTLMPETGEFVQFKIPSPNSGYYNIALEGGALWFTEAGTASATTATKIGVLRMK
jgi:virginiamycin B lyase